MRKSFHTLSGLVRNKIGGDPMNGDVYIFVNKRRNRIKLLHYETGGMVIYAKMLDRGTFGMPIPAEAEPLRERRPLLHRQQPCGERHQAAGPGPEELPVLWEPRCCDTCRHRILPGGQLQGPGRGPA